MPDAPQPTSSASAAAELARAEVARETRSAAVVAFGILLSRLVGLVRQRVAAHYFGTSAIADVISAAFRIGNIAQNLLGEGSLSASFIPVYSRLRGEGRREEAVKLAYSALGLLALAVTLVSALGMVLAPWLTWLVAPGFDEQKRGFTVELVRVVFPTTGLLVLGAWGLGVLNSHRRFFLPYVAPVVWNLVQIGVLMVAGGVVLWRGEKLASALIWAGLAGAGLQFALLAKGASPLLGGLRMRFDTRDPHVREAAARLPAVLLGRGVVQISGYVDTVLVSFLGTGANAVFGYAQMLYLLPMSLLGTGEAAVSLPEMARDTAGTNTAKRNESLRRRLGSAFARTSVLAAPAIAALVLFGREIITVVLQTGAFDRSSTVRVAEVLAIYGFALLGNASGRLLATTCYALGDTSRPARFALARVIVSTAVALALMGPLGVAGVVLGATAAAWLEALLLGWHVRRTVGGLGLEQLAVLRLLALAALCALAPLGLRALLPTELAAGLWGSLAVLAALGLAFALGAPALGLVRLGSLLRRRG